MQYGGPNNVYYHSEHLLWNMTKTRSVISALDDLRAKGVQIDGIMFQVWYRVLSCAVIPGKTSIHYVSSVVRKSARCMDLAARTFAARACCPFFWGVACHANQALEDGAAVAIA
jgi:hypothetical protein